MQNMRIDSIRTFDFRPTIYVMLIVDDIAYLVRFTEQLYRKFREQYTFDEVLRKFEDALLYGIEPMYDYETMYIDIEDDILKEILVKKYIKTYNEE